MPAIRIPRSNFKVRFSGDASGAGRRNVPTFVRGDANAIAGSNFMFFDLSTGELTGLFVLDGVRKHGVTGKNIDVISLNGNGAVVFHDENSAYSQSSSLIWSMAAGPIIVRGGNFTDATWGKYSVDQLGPTVNRQRICLGLHSSGDYILAYRDSINLTDLAGYMKSLGCTDAIAGDGGGSAQLYLEDRNTLFGSDARSVHVIPVALTSYSYISSIA